MRLFMDLDASMTKRPIPTPATPKDPLLVEVGVRIRAERRLRGLTQYQLADKAGTKQSTISAAEVGDADVRLLTLAKLARAMDLSVADFLPRGIVPSMQEEMAKASRELTDVARRVGATAERLGLWGGAPAEGQGSPGEEGRPTD